MVEKFASRDRGQHWLLFVIVSAVLVSFILPQSVAASEEGLFDGVTVVIAPYSANPGINVDGVIASGEFNLNTSYDVPGTDLSVMLIHDNESLFVGIEGPVFGWFALGLSSDLASGMGFILIGSVGGTYLAVERFDSNVSENLEFSPVSQPQHKAIVDFEWVRHGANVTAELELALDSRLWTLAPGQVYPAVMASNATVGNSLPTAASGSGVQFLGGYLLRSEDSVKDVQSLFGGKVSSIPGIVAIVLIAAGVIWIIFEFVIRRGRR